MAGEAKKGIRRLGIWAHTLTSPAIHHLSNSAAYVVSLTHLSMNNL